MVRRQTWSSVAVAAPNITANMASMRVFTKVNVEERLVPRRGRAAAITILRLLFILFLCTQVIGGVLRYTLGIVDAAAVIYIPKALLIAALIFAPVARGRVTKEFAIVALSLAFYFLLGWVTVGPVQAIFGLWVISPLLFGLLIGFGSNWDFWRLRSVACVLFCVACIGVFISALYPVPWIGYSYALGGVELHAAREWTTQGIPRLAGFGRASFAAAAEILILGVIAFCVSGGVVRRWVIWIAGTTAIALTTSKGPLLTWLAVTGLISIDRRFARRRKARWKLAVGLTVGAVWGMPIVAGLLAPRSNLHGTLMNGLLGSFTARLATTWPESFGLLRSGWEWATGLGIGGIGIPMKYFGQGAYLSADNFMVYATVDFGVVGAIGLLLWAVRAAVRLYNPTAMPESWMAYVVLCILMLGLTTNVFEGPVMAMFLGVALALSRRRRGVRPTATKEAAGGNLDVAVCA